MTQKRVALLNSVGFSMAECKALDFLLEQGKNEPFTQRDMDRGADLQQPVVSNALTAFSEKGWVTFTELPSKHGRPHKQYVFLLSGAELFAEIDEMVSRDIKVKEKVLDELRKVL